MKRTCYLAGPVTGLTYDQSEDWRTVAIERLSAVDIVGLSPLRYQEGLRKFGALKADCSEAINQMCTPKGLTARDRWDAMRCDVLLVNFLGAKHVSVGTVMEIAWADAARKPIVMIIEDDGSNPHKHAMIHECVPFRVSTLEEGLDLVEQLIGEFA